MHLISTSFVFLSCRIFRKIRQWRKIIYF